MILPLGFDKFGQSAEILLRHCKTLRTIEEILRRRMELNTQYIEGLKALTAEYSDEGSSEVVDGLLTPLLTQLKQEIDSRILANKNADALLVNLPSTSVLQQDLSMGLMNLLDVKDSYQDTIEAEDAARAAPRLNVTCVHYKPEKLPDKDRRYRKCIITHRGRAEKGKAWLSKYSSILGQYQDCIERGQLALKRACIANIDLVTSLSSHLSTCLQALEAFSSLPLIASANDAYEADIDNTILRPVTYHNYNMDGVESPILFGADLFLPEGRLETLVSRASSGYRGNLFVGYRWMEMFNIEQKSSGIVQFMNSSERLDRRVTTILAVELCHYEPLLPLNTGIDHRLILNPPSRRDFPNLLHTPSESDGLSISRRQRIAHQLSMSGNNPLPLILGIQHMFTPNDPLIEAFWTKWDFMGWCPLPDGVKRLWLDKADRVVVIVLQTGEVYHPSHWEE